MKFKRTLDYIISNWVIGEKVYNEYEKLLQKGNREWMMIDANKKMTVVYRSVGETE